MHELEKNPVLASSYTQVKSRLGFWMVLGLVKPNRLGFFSLFQKADDFVKTIIFVHLKSWELF